MDICFNTAKNQTHIKVNSIHGMLWLQTHFESKHWEAIADERVILSISDAEMLAIDASRAGLTINLVPAISY